MRTLRREEGQVLPLLLAGLLVCLLGIAALVLDAGRAYVVKRQLQSTADAVALAAADALPSTSAALTAAAEFGPTGKNPVTGVTVSQTVQPWCLRSVAYCFGNAAGTIPANGQANGVVVREEASVPTAFGKLFGIHSIDVSAKSTACATCGSRPLDIAIVVDRTGSMSDNMADMRSGVRSFLQALDPSLDYVTLLVFPPLAGGGACATPSSSVLYPGGSDSTYTVTRMSHDYLNADGTLNRGSPLVAAVDCMQPGGATHYKQALVEAQNELLNHGSGRPNVQRAIVFESDGAANTVPSSYLTGFLTPAAGHSGDVQRPCGSAVDYANATIKPAGTLVYTVAYAVNLDDDCYAAPHVEQNSRGQWSLVGYKSVREQTSASESLSAIASPGGAVTQSTQSDMTASFQKVATKLLDARLVPDAEGS